MATINRSYLNEIARRLDVVSASGRSTIEQIMIDAPQNFDFNELFYYVRDQYLPIVEVCTESAAALGASAYDATREIEVGEAFGAVAESSYDELATTNAVGAFVNTAINNQDMSSLVDNLGRRLDSEVMRSYTHSQLANGRYDDLDPTFARIPSGPNPCDFCRALAGHGFFYKSRASAGEFDKFHDFCRCQVVAKFSKEAEKLEIEGYDPDVYVQEWRQTQKQFGSGRSGGTYARKVSSGRTAMPKIETPLLSEAPEEVRLPEKCYGGEWDQKADMEEFLSTMYNDDEYVGTCSEFYDKDGRRVPTKGMYQRTAGQIENVLDRTNNVSSAVGRYHTRDGAYVRVNPLDGKGVTASNVTNYRYTLLECDTGSLEQQYGYIQALNLPTQTVCTSGKKSVHAVVRIDASNYEEYKERVALLHAECQAAGYEVDASTKDPSRYMRIPGVKRGDGRQCLVSTNEGAGSWDEWRAWCDQNRN